MKSIAKIKTQWHPPKTISQRVSHYRRIVRKCQRCTGPIHPLWFRGTICPTCKEEWGLS